MGYISNIGIIPLCIKLLQMNGYVNSNNECMNFFVCDKELLKTYNDIWKKINNLLKKG